MLEVNHLDRQTGQVLDKKKFVVGVKSSRTTPALSAVHRSGAHNRWKSFAHDSPSSAVCNLKMAPTCHGP